MRKSSCAVLVSSCDKYADAWMPFFHFFMKYWKDCPYTIYLNTEHETYSDQNLTVNMLHSIKKNCSWSTRLKDSLKRIDTEYIIFLLEDFFFQGPVNQSEVEKCISYMDNNRKISVIDFEYVPRISFLPSQYDGYVERAPKAMYHLNCQAAIWRRKDLIRYLSPHESPWQFELNGSERAKLYNKVFLMQGKAKDVFVYNVNWETGYGLHGGKWLKSNVDLFKKEHIDVDFTKMGFYDGHNVSTSCPIPRKSIAWKLMYLLYGGFNEQPRMPLNKQIKYLFIHPRTFARAVINKICFLFNK